MKNIKHTPGPWHVTEDANGKCTIRHQACGRFDNNEIVETTWQDGKGTHRANARLIASAPELLEALECVREQLIFDQKDREIADLWATSIKIIDKAIAKAEGR